MPGTLPGGTTGTQGVAAPAPTASPQSASNVVTAGDSVSPQPLPEVMGWTGTIAFPQPSAAPLASPSPKATASATPAAAATPASVSIGVTSSVIDPPDAPHFAATEGKGHHAGKHAGGALTGLYFISLLSTADVTLGSYPKIAVDMPREIAAKYHDATFALGLYDPQTKTKAYALAVAERDLSSPAPQAAAATPLPPSPLPTATDIPNGMAAFTPPPVGTGLQAGNLPPEHVAFAGTVAPLTLKANIPTVFAIYAVPPAPQPSGSPHVPTSPSPSPAVPSPTSSATPAASPAASPLPS